MQRAKFFTVDLNKVQGRGEFSCPKCGVKISPDDKTENAYTILEPVMKRNCLEKIILQCNRCGSRIHITGFQVLNKAK